jgi:hypothetical protein
MGASAVTVSFFDVFGLGVVPLALVEASLFLRVSRFSLCSRGGARGRARAAGSGLGLSGEDTAGVWSSSSGRFNGGARLGVLAREWACESAIVR